MNIFLVYLVVSSIIIGFIFYIVLKVHTFSQDQNKLTDFVNKYKYLAYVSDVISVYTDYSVRDPNDGVLDSRLKNRCGFIDNYVIFSLNGYVSKDPISASLTFSSQEACEFYLFNRFDMDLPLTPIYDPCTNQNSLECQKLIINL